jgi:hypothetical protein
MLTYFGCIYACCIYICLCLYIVTVYLSCYVVNAMLNIIFTFVCCINVILLIIQCMIWMTTVSLVTRTSQPCFRPLLCWVLECLSDKFTHTLLCVHKLHSYITHISMHNSRTHTLTGDGIISQELVSAFVERMFALFCVHNDKVYSYLCLYIYICARGHVHLHTHALTHTYKHTHTHSSPLTM